MNNKISKLILRAMLLMLPLIAIDSYGQATKKKSSGGGFFSKIFGGKSSGKGKKGDDPLAGIKNGEIVATARKGYKQSAPAGMQLIPAGSYTMGQTDEDILASRVTMNKRVTVSAFYMDDTEISNNEYRMFTNSLLADSASVLGEEFIMKNYYPDTTVWKTDFAYHNGDQLTENYFNSPAFDDYPVVGVSWDAATYFCRWRTELLNHYRVEHDDYKSPSFRLPSEAEWEWAAKGGKEGAKYPWGNPYVANGKGCYLANFKPFRGNYQKDGYQYTAPVKAYMPNDYGLYNMSGNVAEWTRDAYSESYMPLTWDLNPSYDIKEEPRKVIKGGSWKDVAYFLETGTTTYEYKNTKKSYIGFRCVMDRLGSVPGRE